MRTLSLLHTYLYRATNGLVGRRLVNNDMLLLTTEGARTGRPHTVPLLYLSSGERIIVIASYGGRPRHPQWYSNLVLRPQASIQIRETHRRVMATTMTEAEHDEWWPEIVAAYADYATYQDRTDRPIPTVWLD